MTQQHDGFELGPADEGDGQWLELKNPADAARWFVRQCSAEIDRAMFEFKASTGLDPAPGVPEALKWRILCKALEMPVESAMADTMRHLPAPPLTQ